MLQAELSVDIDTGKACKADFTTRMSCGMSSLESDGSSKQGLAREMGSVRMDAGKKNSQRTEKGKSARNLKIVQELVMNKTPIRS